MEPKKQALLPAKLALAMLAIGAGAPAWAVPVTVNATFTTFTSWMFDQSVQQSYVNGTALTSSGVVVGNNGAVDFYRSNTLNLTNPSSRVDFRYGSVAPGSAGENSFVWTPNTFDYQPGFGFCSNDPSVNCAAPVGPGGYSFPLGTLQFTNGFWYREADIGIRLTTSSADPTLNGHVYNGIIHVVSTSPQDLTNPYAQADYFSLSAAYRSTSGRVFDSCCQPPGNPGNVGNFLVYGYIGSLHIATLFADPNSPAAFTDSSLTDDRATTDVPEPASLGLLGLGFAGLGLRRRERRAS